MKINTKELLESWLNSVPYSNESTVRDYKATWTIELYARSPEEAAHKALAIQRDMYSMATFFVVTDKNTGRTTEVDIEPTYEGETA